MRLLLDDHLSRKVAEALRERGHDVVCTRECRLHELHDDRELWSRAIDLGRVVVTYDKDDFPALYDEFFTEGISHPGLILFFSSTIAQHDLGGQIRYLARVLQS